MRSFLGSFLAVFWGWLAAVVFVELMAIFTALFGTTHYEPIAFVTAPLLFGIYMLPLIVPVWLLIYFPLYHFVPLRSVFWSLPVCTLLGVLAGMLVVLATLGYPGEDKAKEIWVPYALSAIVGGVTCIAGSLSRFRFRAVASGA
jgi:hypothetical protein